MLHNENDYYFFDLSTKKQHSIFHLCQSMQTLALPMDRSLKAGAESFHSRVVPSPPGFSKHTIYLLVFYDYLNKKGATLHLTDRPFSSFLFTN